MFEESDSDRVIVSEGPATLRIAAHGVGYLTLNTPESANCLNNEMLKAMYDALMYCLGDSQLRVLVLSGKGKNFCAGGDIKTFTSKGDDLPFYIRQATGYLQQVVSLMMRLQVPLVTAVQGFAAGGGGFGFVCASDIVIAEQSAKFLAGATRVGMAPDAGMSVTLQNLVGFRQAMHILLTNPVISAQDAKDLGILTQVVTDGTLADSVQRYANDLAAGAPRALSETKRLMWNAMGSRVEECLDDEARTVSALSGTQDSMEAMKAILEKRSPTFSGR